ncbi:MAG: SDR family NAD(P)-dependent oxidoreductase, partial [Hyphomicrobiales bacterium]|nr:SDR family NAD(P)-dependent oxidoreductase [Hyphomicrobiales bacterium]
MVEQRVAVVTGSTSGIGLGVARAFAAQGANVVLNGFGAPEDIERERFAIEKEFGVKALYSGADMSKAADIVGMIDVAEEALGPVDVLVNNAG